MADTTVVKKKKKKKRKKKYRMKTLDILKLALGASLLLFVTIGFIALIYFSTPLKDVYCFSLQEKEVLLSTGDGGVKLTPVYTLTDAEKLSRVVGKKERTKVTWKSEDDRICEVDQNGLVTPVDKGETEIVASWAGMTARVPVRVFYGVESIRFTEKETEVEIGERLTLNYRISPADADVQEEIRMTVSDESLARVTNDGLLSALNAGDVEVTVSCGQKKDTCTVHLLSHMEDFVLLEEELSFNRGETYEFTTHIFPEDTTDDVTVKWTSSDESVVSVGDNGFMMAVNYGEADVTAVCGDFERTCHVSVSVPLESITLGYSAVSMQQGTSYAIPVYYRPKDYPHDTRTVWTSSNEAVCTVREEMIEDGTGHISARVIVTSTGAGAAVITGTNGELSTTCSVTVNVRITGVNISQSTLSLDAGESRQLSAQVVPYSAEENTRLYWVSSNPSVAAVVNGVVTARAGGTAVISAVYSGLAAHCTVTVAGDPPSSEGGLSGRILIGDSRMVYLQRFVTLDEGDIIIAKGAQYFTWFRDEAVPTLRSILNVNPNYEVVINMGVNDSANNCHGWREYFAEDYAALIRQLKNDYPSARFSFASVGYCNGLYDRKIPADQLNPWIDSFNAYFANNCPDINYLPLGEYLFETGYSTLDGVHFDQTTCNKIYQYIRSAIPVN